MPVSTESTAVPKTNAPASAEKSSFDLFELTDQASDYLDLPL